MYPMINVIDLEKLIVISIYKHQ